MCNETLNLDGQMTGKGKQSPVYGLNTLVLQ